MLKIGSNERCEQHDGERSKGVSAWTSALNNDIVRDALNSDWLEKKDRLGACRLSAALACKPLSKQCLAIKSHYDAVITMSYFSFFTIITNIGQEK